MFRARTVAKGDGAVKDGAGIFTAGTVGGGDAVDEGLKGVMLVWWLVSRSWINSSFLSG
jgi:hypothetical protein